jgi:CheY-like chemotaxis protein
MARLDPAAKTSDEAPAQVMRVLVVNENEADRQNMVSLIGQAWPFESELIVEHASHSQAALEKLVAAKFSLIVVDWSVPETRGGELLRSFRRAGARIPTVIVSDLRRHEILDDIEALGASFLNKAEMDVVNFRDAIASSLRMMGRLNLADTTSIRPKTSLVSAPPAAPRPTQ